MSKTTSSAVATPLAQVETPLLAVALGQGGSLPASLGELDRAAGGVIARAMTSGDFRGKRDETALLYPNGGKAERVLLVGVGKPGEVTRSGQRTSPRASGWVTRSRRGTSSRATSRCSPATCARRAISPNRRNGWPRPTA